MGFIRQASTRIMVKTVRSTISVATSDKLVSHYNKCNELYRNSNDDKCQQMLAMLQIDLSHELARRGIITDMMEALRSDEASGEK